jgi:hypothetical protein
MGTKETLSWVNAAKIIFMVIAFIAFLIATDDGFTCCLTSVIIIVILGAWEKQLKGKVTIEEQTNYDKGVWEYKLNQARIYENQLDYDQALSLYRELNMTDDVRRINEIKYNKMGGRESGGNTTIIQGNYVNDHDTIIKDSVLNRSNVGGSGTSKIDELEKASVLKEKGLINDDEYEQMKKEILGK